MCTFLPKMQTYATKTQKYMPENLKLCEYIQNFVKYVKYVNVSENMSEDPTISKVYKLCKSIQNFAQVCKRMLTIANV